MRMAPRKSLAPSTESRMTPARTLRMRVIAGPNGSGKTTLYEWLRSEESFDWGMVQNPDAIERDLNLAGKLDFSNWAIRTHTAELRTGLAARKDVGSRKIAVRNNVLHVAGKDSKGYFVAALCEFMRRKWIESGVSFTFETVMSHPGKLEQFRAASAAGFRTYLYFVCTRDPRINQERVKARVRDGGHSVPKEKIAERYKRSMELLPEAVRLVNRAFLFDNSGHWYQWFASFTDGQLSWKSRSAPAWFKESGLA
jgi:predicted ABC-type ATPase